MAAVQRYTSVISSRVAKTAWGFTAVSGLEQQVAMYID
jgi:hypothetical protein